MRPDASTIGASPGFTPSNSAAIARLARCDRCLSASPADVAIVAGIVPVPSFGNGASLVRECLSFGRGRSLQLDRSSLRAKHSMPHFADAVPRHFVAFCGFLKRRGDVGRSFARVKSVLRLALPTPVLLVTNKSRANHNEPQRSHPKDFFFFFFLDAYARMAIERSQLSRTKTKVKRFDSHLPQHFSLPRLRARYLVVTSKPDSALSRSRSRGAHVQGRSRREGTP